MNALLHRLALLLEAKRDTRRLRAAAERGDTESLRALFRAYGRRNELPPDFEKVIEVYSRHSSNTSIIDVLLIDVHKILASRLSPVIMRYLESVKRTVAPVSLRHKIKIKDHWGAGWKYSLTAPIKHPNRGEHIAEFMLNVVVAAPVFKGGKVVKPSGYEVTFTLVNRVMSTRERIHWFRFLIDKLEDTIGKSPNAVSENESTQIFRMSYRMPDSYDPKVWGKVFRSHIKDLKTVVSALEKRE